MKVRGKFISSYLKKNREECKDLEEKICGLEDKIRTDFQSFDAKLLENMSKNKT